MTTPIHRLPDIPPLPRLLPTGWLRGLGIHGYDAIEDVILAALISEDPLLLVGKAGTGKTFLLNALSETLTLEHRHYNASLIAFDDLVGFPYPSKNGDSIRYIETPATIWQAQSVLIDEISRCKPEHQNRLFSLVHERRIQGLPLPRLRYRWAAMNPCEAEDGDVSYDGSNPLDQALADRFAFILEVPDWPDLREADRSAIANPHPANERPSPTVQLARAVAEGRQRFATASDALHHTVATYASAVASQLLGPGIRLSPRRVRTLSRNLIALTLATGGQPERETFFTALAASLPQLAWGLRVADPVIRAAHATAWDLLTQGPETRWLSQVLLEPDLPARCTKVLDHPPSPDTATMAIRRSLVSLQKTEAAIFALALLPAIQQRAGEFGEESLAAVLDTATPILEVKGEATWRLRVDLEPEDNPHPTLSACAALLDSLPPRRRERARQLFYHCLTQSLPIPDPAALEATLDRAVRAVKPYLHQKNK